MPPLLATITTSLIHDQRVRFPLLLLYGGGASDVLATLSLDVLSQLHSHDVLIVGDYSQTLGKTHTLKIENPDNEDSKTLKTTHTYTDIGAREINEWLSGSPLETIKCVVIENIQRATTGAINGMLKNFEEPLPDRCIIVTASSLDDVLPTIISRAVLVYCPQMEIEDIQTRYPDTVYAAACTMYDLITTDSASARISIAKETKSVATTLHVLDYIDCLIEIIGSQKNGDTHHIYIPRLIQAKKHITSNVSKEHVLYGALTT